MRILYTAAGIPVPGSHGGSVHALQLCRALSRRGHEVHLVAQRPSADTEAADLDGVILHPLSRRAWPPQLEWTMWRAVRRVAREVQPDIVVERFYTFGGTGLLAARALGVPAVLEINSPARPYPGSLRDRIDALTLVRPVDRWRRWQLRVARRTYTTGAVLVPEALRAETTVIVNGVDAERIRPGPGIGSDGPLRCVYVSSFRSWHGAVDLVRALVAARARGADLHLTCIGDGPTRQAAQRAAGELPDPSYVDFTGSIPHAEVARYLAAAHVGVAPFDPRAFRALELGWFWSPIKIFEYLAAGLPVVTADIPELRELLPGAVGHFYPAGDVDALARLLRSLAEDRDGVRAAAGAAREIAVARYTWDRQAEVVEGVLESARASAVG